MKFFVSFPAKSPTPAQATFSVKGPVMSLFLTICTLAWTAPAFAQSPSWFDPTLIDDAPLAPAVRTQLSGEYNGSKTTYEVIAGELLLHDAEGAPAATLFSTAYIRTDAGAQANRPVIFLFNGGPGASSSPLHLGIGPMRRPELVDSGQPDMSLVPNPASPIDAADMVFVDPVGTGFTRLLKEGAGEQFWGTEPDADAALLLVKTWLEQNERTDSPVFLMGESYGGTRVAAMAGQAKDVHISGVLLLSPALDFSAGAQVVGNNLPYIFQLPSMAATAAYHGVTDAAGRSYLQVFHDAAEYAQSGYAAALYQGHTIAAAEKQAVASRLAELTGLDETYILESNLRIAASEFADRLLASEGMRVGRLDTRAKGLLSEYKDKRPPGNDPSMSGKSTGGPSTGEVLDEYYSEKLNIKIDRPYRTLNLDLNQKWDYGQKNGQFKSYFSVVPKLQDAMKRDADLRVFVGGGVFDLGTPIMAARYAVSQIDASPDRFMLAGYEGGHATFEHEASRVALCDDIREFVATTLAAALAGADDQS